MENKRQQLLIVVAVMSAIAAVKSSTNPCRDLVENDICGQAGPMTKRCRKVDPNCAGVYCHLICVPENKGNPKTRNECLSGPCLNGATCVDHIGSYSCQCDAGWTGSRCDQEINECESNPCVHGTCIDHIGFYSCQCDAGWTGTNCDQDIDDCSSGPCIHGSCTDQLNAYTCQCQTGWIGVNCDVLDYDECTSGPCVHGSCTDQPNAYSCQCSPGWTGPMCSLPDCTNGSPLFCNCVSECADAIDEAICDCSQYGYSLEFATIYGKFIQGWHVGSILSGVTQEQCKNHCLSTPGCHSADFGVIFNDCYLNSVTPFEQPGDVTSDRFSQLLVRICSCTR